MRKAVDHVKHKGEADEVLEAIHAVMHLYRARQYRVLRDGEHDVTHLESKVLGFFAHHPGATLSELSAHSGRDKGQLARLVGGLRERGLIEARVDEADRRNQRLHLTPEGEQAQQLVKREGRKVATAAVRGLSVQERQQLLELLGRVHANLQDASPD